jgi:hypothetical protein
MSTFNKSRLLLDIFRSRFNDIMHRWLKQSLCKERGNAIVRSPKIQKLPQRNSHTPTMGEAIVLRWDAKTKSMSVIGALKIDAAITAPK